MADIIDTAAMLVTKRRIFQACAPHVETVQSGNTEDCTYMAHFKTTDSYPLKDLTVTLPYSSTGYTSILVKAAGINLLECTSYINGLNKGVTYTEYEDSDHQTIRVHISGTTTNSNNFFRNLNYVDQELHVEDAKLATCGYSDHANIICTKPSGSYQNMDGHAIATMPLGWQRYDLRNGSAAANGTSWIRIQLYPYAMNAVTLDSDIYPMCCLLQDMGCTFEPYKKRHITITMPSTIYGGTVNILTGDILSEYASDGTKLSSPTLLQTSANSLSALKGVNNIWSNHGSVSVSYWTR